MRWPFRKRTENPDLAYMGKYRNDYPLPKVGRDEKGRFVSLNNDTSKDSIKKTSPKASQQPKSPKASKTNDKKNHLKNQNKRQSTKKKR